MKKEKIQGIVKSSLLLDTQVLITNNKTMIIETCKKILEYNDICLKFISNTGLLIQIWGKELSISECTNESLIVKGTIDSVEFFPHKGVKEC